MFGFDNTRDDGSQPQDTVQYMGPPTTADPMVQQTTPTMPNETYEAAPQPVSMPDPMASPFAQDNAQPTDQNDDSNQTPVANPANDLLAIKQDALQKLSPLVGHLDQTPEEKFKTTMMMIQASDDQSLVGAAYEAANAISDEKVKAQALLDIVNEINYFTQHHEK